MKYSIGHMVRLDNIGGSILIVTKIKMGQINYSNHVKTNREQKINVDNTENMPTLKIDLEVNPNSCKLKINNQNICVLLKFRN